MAPMPEYSAQDASATFGARLRSHRLRAGLSQEALAERADLSGATLSALEQGLRRAPYPHTVRSLSAALGLSAEESAAFVEAARPPARKAMHRAPVPDPPRRATLPRPLTSLVGRESDVGAVQRQLDRSPLVTLVGPGGIGKTRLALEVGNRAKVRFRDGVWFVDLSPIDNPALIASGVAAALGVREQVHVPVLDTLSEALRARQTLLILDNCEHLIHGCAVLAQHLLGACPGLALLATSREPLAVAGELVWPVPPLEQPGQSGDRSPSAVLQHAASQLFVERVQAAQPGFALDEVSAPVVADIVRRLDGIPLALELAATRVRALGVAGLAERLDDRLRLLVSGRAAPARQQTLRATLDWSYDLLGQPDQQLFVRLASFAGGWRLADAEAVCAGADIPRQDVARRMVNLVDQSLVVGEERSGAMRYRLLETMRQYAADRLNELGVAEAACSGHRNHYLAMAERVPSERYTLAHMDWLASEADNLRAALRWSINRDEFEDGFRVAAAMQGLWYVRGFLTEGRAWLNELLDRAGSAAETVLGGRAVGGAARLAFMQGDMATASLLAERCWEIAERLADERGIALAAIRRAVVARGQGNVERARELSEEALRRSRAMGDADLQVFSLYGLSACLLVLGERDKAAQLARECLTISGSVGHAWGISSARRVLGMADQRSARVARSHLEQSLVWSRQLGYAQGVVYALTALGKLALAEDDTRAARAHLADSLKLADELGDRLEMLHCLEDLAQTEPMELGAQIAGAAAALRAAIGASPVPHEHDRLTRWSERARRSLGETHFAELWADGQMADLHDLVAELICQPVEGVSNRATVDPRLSGGLTKREMEVARLVARGLSSRAIASELVITEGTAKVHVARILSKLDLHSRAQLAVWVVQNELGSGPGHLVCAQTSIVALHDQDGLADGGCRRP
jgi:predicted ATPase/DNA-binding CsgD family transcriptional regulator/transcriptional regulator with XRE-family HTH domain